MGEKKFETENTDKLRSFTEERRNLEKKKILFITTKNNDYIRIQQEIKLLNEIVGDTVILSSNRQSYAGRMIEIYRKLLFFDYSKVDVVFIGFMAQMVVPFIHNKLSRNVVYVDFFISIYDTLAFDRKIISRRGLLSRVSRWIDKTTLKYADKVVCDTIAHGEYFIDEFHVASDKMRVLYLEADKDIYYLRKRKKPIEWEDKFLVLYFGSILPLQGIDVVLKAIELLSNDNSIHFILIGPIRKKCKAKNENVTYIKWLSQDELAEFISFSDLCLAGHFSKNIEKANRTIPGKAYIYHMMGKRMILGDSVANKEIFDEKDNLFVERGNPEMLSRLIKSIAGEDKKNI